MKKLLLLFFITLSYIGTAYSHSGRTDSKGGHWNHSENTYHYHIESDSSDSLEDIFPEPPSDPCRHFRQRMTTEECIHLNRIFEVKALCFVLKQSMSEEVFKNWKSNTEMAKKHCN